MEERWQRTDLARRELELGAPMACQHGRLVLAGTPPFSWPRAEIDRAGQLSFVLNWLRLDLRAALNYNY